MQNIKCYSEYSKRSLSDLNIDTLVLISNYFEFSDIINFAKTSQYIREAMQTLKHKLIHIKDTCDFEDFKFFSNIKDTCDFKFFSNVKRNKSIFEFKMPKKIQIQHLIIENNNFSNIAIILARCDKQYLHALKLELRCSSNDVTKIMGILPDIKKLYIHTPFYYKKNEVRSFQSEISDRAFLSISQITNLTNLNLGNCKIKDGQLEYISELYNLETLNLGNSDITDDGLKYLSKLGNELDIL